MNLYIETSGRGPDLVMLHGWGLHGGIFSNVAAALSRHWCVHRVDLPGHGATPCLARFDADAVADALAAAFPIPVHVIGWSLGGLIAQYWAARHPHAVSSLALVASSPCFVEREDWPHAQSRTAIEAVGASLEREFEATLERFLALQMLGAPGARDTLKAVREDLFSHGRPQGLLAALHLLLSTDARALAARIRCPVGLFFGERDVITPIGAGRWLAEHLADATLYSFPRASHAPFLSHEKEFLQEIGNFLDSHA
ncbi:pimeloyl-ACP methyl ester esterase BioH [Paludibacterium yongneupense]|uniref:pimeloyl-ACP methyl ester esterase BioH n=1 Tax=Paludibacterium yongneupense TaxID=400061 RepID=UPI0003F6DF6E|nr:pimeloyl-ACP methyl ester esterase BioH [Paludibacterium yongneupense]